MPVKSRYTYGTDDEIVYIQSLGRTHLNTQKIPRKELLQSYIDACHLRNDWRGMERDVIIAFATEELKATK
jgi:hypothetical protein